MENKTTNTLYCHFFLDKSKGIYKSLKLSLPDLTLNIDALKYKIQELVAEINKNETGSTRYKLQHISKTISSPAITNKTRVASFFNNRDDVFCKVEVEIKPMKSQINSSAEDVQFKTLTKYSFYEATKKVVKVLIDLPGVHTVPKENIISKFDVRSVEVKIMNLKGLNYYFGVPMTQCGLDPANSEVLITENKITIRIRKEKEDDHWPSLYKFKYLLDK